MLRSVNHFKTIDEFKLKLQSRNTQFGSKSVIFLSPVTLKFDGWPWKTTGHLFYTTLSFVHHIKAIGEFKLELQPGNAQFGSKSAIFCPLWPWNLMNDLKKTIGYLFYTTLSFVHHFIAIAIEEFKLELHSGKLNLGQNWRFFSPCDLGIWWMTLKNNRAPFLCCFKLCASFHSHYWIETGVTVQKRPMWIKIGDFFSRVILEIWPMTLKSSRAPQLSNFKLSASFHRHMWN